MKTEDARSLSAKAQEALRRRVVQAVGEGLTQAEAARLFGVARGTVNGWMGLWEREGSPGLKAGRRGRPPCPRLAPPQAATTVRLILSRCPDQLRLPFALWTREAVQQLLARRLDRKSTRLNSSHVRISYAVFCLKKKKWIPMNSSTTSTRPAGRRLRVPP